MASANQDVSQEPTSANVSREIRVDAAHALRRPDSGSPANDVVAVVAQQQHYALAGAEEVFGQLIDANASPEVLARQAVDLALQLKDQLAELDRRTERINAQEADFDSRVRNARLWLDERENELDAQEKILHQRETELSEQAAQPRSAFDQEQLEEREQSLVSREENLAKMQAELEFAQSQIEEKLSELEIQTALCKSKQAELDEKKQACEQRQRELDQREAEIFKGN